MWGQAAVTERDSAVPSTEERLSASEAAVESANLPGLARAELVRVLESAARLQQVVPDAVLVGGSAAALWAGHRTSYDHDHVVSDLEVRFEAVLEAIEATDGWVTNRVAPGKIILGELGGIETGVRQLLRRRPLEVTEVALPSGQVVRVPTLEETLRIKGYLIVRRNQTRVFLDVAALSHRCGLEHAAAVLSRIDEYYSDQRDPSAQGVASQLVLQLADPAPADPLSSQELSEYKKLDQRWENWKSVVAVTRSLAARMVEMA